MLDHLVPHRCNKGGRRLSGRGYDHINCKDPPVSHSCGKSGRIDLYLQGPRGLTQLRQELEKVLSYGCNRLEDHLASP
jgi:hypothetical protein